MWLHKFRRLLAGPGKISPARRHKASVRCGRVELLLERLEDRALPATINVAAGNVAALTEALRKAIASPDTAKAMGQRGFERIQTWSYEEDIRGLRHAIAMVTRRLSA